MDTSIQFAEQTAPSAQNNASSHNAIGGVVRLRSRTQSVGHGGPIDLAKPRDYDDAEDEDAGLRNEADYKRSQVSAVVKEILLGRVQADKEPTGFQHWPNIRARIPVHRCHLWRYRYFPSIRLLFHVYSTA